MKRTTICALALLALLAAAPGTAGAARFGMGLVVGDPTGIDWKLWTTRRTALDGCVGWAFGDAGFSRITLDYLWHSPLRIDTGRLWFHYGIGGSMWLGHRYRHTLESSGLGVRGVFGLERQFPRSPFSLYGEVAPTMNVTPVGWFDLQGGVGFRFYF